MQIDKINKFAELYNRVPAEKETYKSCKIGFLYKRMRRYPQYWITKFTNRIIIADLQYCINHRAKIKPKFVSTGQWVELIENYVAINNHIPTFECNYYGYDIGDKLDKIKQNPVNWRAKFTNEKILNYLDDGLSLKKNYPLWIKLINRYVSQHHCLPIHCTEFRGYKIGNKFNKMCKNPDKWYELFYRVLTFPPYIILREFKRQKDIWIDKFLFHSLRS
jgi:hypothetical protein